MLDFSSRLGRHVNSRLRREKVIWFTTVDSERSPQPRPVWFHWDGKTILILLNFNTDEDGGDVAVLTSEAKILDDPPPTDRIKNYLRKYTQGIKDLDMTVAEFRERYTVPILVTPQNMRGFIE